MNGITILIWITIAIIAIIAIIIVKLHYKGDELESDEGSILPSQIQDIISDGQKRIQNTSTNTHNSNFNTKQQPASLIREGSDPSYNAYIVPEVNGNKSSDIEYESQNQVLVNYGNEVQMFQEPIKQSQIDIMTQNTNKNKTDDTSKHELKDLFTIDELIKESKRKDSERENEAKKINREEEDLTELKESIKNKKEEKLVEEVPEETHEISDAIKSSKDEDEKIESTTSQKDIEEAINSAAKEKEEVEDISESESITDVLLDNTEEKIKTPTLKTPTKVDENKDYRLGGELEESNLFGDSEDEMNDLDYRKDLAKITNTIKGSKIFQDVREKLSPEAPEEEYPQEESYIRNVNEYDDEYATIINKTHADYEASYEEYHNDDFDQRLRQENTRKVFNLAKNTPEPELAQSKIGAIKDKPSRDNIKIQLNNNEEVLKKGDEIIFRHDGETYSSQVYAINGDDISVKYRRKNITIKPSDVKKIY